MNKAVVFDCDGTLLDMQSGGRPFAGIVELLQKLKEQDYQLFVWTARDRLSLERYLIRENLMRYFDDVRTISEAAPKPSPEGLAQLLGKLPADQAVVIGDSWTDMQGAKIHGCFALGAVWNNISEPEVLEGFGADEIVHSPFDCFESIKLMLAGNC